MKFLVIGSVFLGAVIFSLFPIVSAKFFPPTWMGTLKFNLYFLPFAMAGNLLLAWGFMQGAKLLGNTPLLIGIQIGTVSILGAVFSMLLLQQKISVYGFFGIILIIVGILLLNK